MEAVAHCLASVILSLYFLSGAATTMLRCLQVLIGSLLMAFGAFGVAVAFWRMGSLFASCGAAMGVLCPLTVPISTPSERLAAAAITGMYCLSLQARACRGDYWGLGVS